MESGKAMYGMGTVECICPAFPKPTFSDTLMASNLCTYDFTVDGMYTTVAFSLTGGNLFRWYRDQFCQEESKEAKQRGVSVYEQLLQAMPDQPTDMMVLPHFTPTGTPSFDPDATGAILGLKLSHTRLDILRALLEGVSMEMKLNVELLDESGIKIKELIAIGGGAQSTIMTQLKADILNRPITTVAVTEAGCLGVAMLASHALNQEPLASITSRWVKPLAQIEPRAESATIYEDKFTLYKQLYPTLKTLRGK